MPKITGSNVKHLSGNSLQSIWVALPPIEIQHIVANEFFKLLDEFTSTRMAIDCYRKKCKEILLKNEIVKE